MSKDKQNAAAQAREEHLAALKVEREGYVARGLGDRVKQVDAQIKAHSGQPVGRSAPRPEDAAQSAAAATEKQPAKKTTAAPSKV